MAKPIIYLIRRDKDHGTLRLILSLHEENISWPHDPSCSIRFEAHQDNSGWGRGEIQIKSRYDEDFARLYKRMMRVIRNMGNIELPDVMEKLGNLRAERMIFDPRHEGFIPFEEIKGPGYSRYWDDYKLVSAVSRELDQVDDIERSYPMYGVVASSPEEARAELNEKFGESGRWSDASKSYRIAWLLADEPVIDREREFDPTVPEFRPLAHFVVHPGEVRTWMEERLGDGEFGPEALTEAAIAEFGLAGTDNEREVLLAHIETVTAPAWVDEVAEHVVADYEQQRMEVAA